MASDAPSDITLTILGGMVVVATGAFGWVGRTISAARNDHRRDVAEVRAAMRQVRDEKIEEHKAIWTGIEAASAQSHANAVAIQSLHAHVEEKVNRAVSGLREHIDLKLEAHERRSAERDERLTRQLSKLSQDVARLDGARRG